MEDTVCQPCSDDGNQMEAYGFCQDCGEYLCQDCYLGHCKPRPTRNHTLLDMDQLKKETPTKKKQDTSNELCTQHGGEYIKYFCSTHNVTGCSACITIDHLNCSGNVVFIPQVAESVVNSEELQSLKRNIKSMRTPLTYMISTSADNIARVEDNHAEMTTAILKYGKEISAAIQKLENSSRSEADAFKQESLDTANVAISTCKKHLNILHDMRKELKVAEETGNYCKLFIAVKTYTRAIKDIQDKVKQLTLKNKVKPLIFTPLTELRVFLNKFHGLCVFTDKPSAPDCSVEYSSSEPEYEKTGPIRISASYMHDVYVRSQTDQEDFCQVTSMTLASKTKLVLIDGRDGNNKVKLIDTSAGTLLSELQFKDPSHDRRWPSYVVNMDNHRVVVGLSNNKWVLVNIGTSLTIDRHISSTSYSGMCYYPNDGLYACNNYSIMKLDLYGKETALIEAKSLGNVLFKEHLIKSSPSVFYVVSQDLPSYKSYVACLTTDGKIARKIIFKTKPEDIAVDNTGRILFVLSGGVIHVLEAGSTEARALCTKKDGLCRASAIAYCPESKRLYVGISDSNNIKVYQLSGMPRI